MKYSDEDMAKSKNLAFQLSRPLYSKQAEKISTDVVLEKALEGLNKFSNGEGRFPIGALIVLLEQYLNNYQGFKGDDCGCSKSSEEENVASSLISLFDRILNN